MVKNESFNNVYMTKQCALFRHTLPLTKQQMDKHICKKRKGKDYDCMEDEMKKTLQWGGYKKFENRTASVKTNLKKTHTRG